MPTPSFSASKASLANAKVDVVVIGVATADDELVLDEASDVLADGLVDALAAVGFDGKADSTARLPLDDARAASLVAVGLGDDREDTETLRRAAAAAVGAARGATSVATSLGAGGGVAALHAVVEGFLLATHTFDDFRSEAGIAKRENSTVSKVALHGPKPADAKRAITLAQATAGAQLLARDLCNTPPHAKRPPALADRAKALAKGTGLKVKVLDDVQLAKQGYGGLIGVGQGSDHGPRLVELTWAPRGARGHVALVGKGITFDTGGLNLKSGQGMRTMKMDMAGAGTVLAVLLAVAELDLPIRVTGLMALAENMPSGTATRPSDVLRMRSGATVEVLNTDAEGRLVLADALDHAAEQQPDCIVDMATLTGAAITSLGHEIGMLVATDDQLADELLAASDAVGEAFARFPLAKEQYGKDLESDTADVKNAYLGDGAGSIKAALFLEHFVPDDVPWAHLDIAGVAWAKSARNYVPKDGTGIPARTILHWLRQRAEA